MTDQRQVCTFALDSFLFGVEVEDVQEVIKNQPMTHVPMAPKEVCGLVNLRGQIMSVIDLRCRLELPKPDPDQTPILVIVKPGSQAVGLLVDRVEDVIYVDDQDRGMLPGTLQGIGRDLIRAAYKLPDRLMLLLDAAQVVDIETVTTDSGAVRW